MPHNACAHSAVSCSEQLCRSWGTVCIPVCATPISSTAPAVAHSGAALQSCPAGVRSGDLAVSGEWESRWRRAWLQRKGAQELMSIVWRLQPVYFNSMKRNLMAVNELMQTPARAWAFCNSLPSLLPAVYSKPKPDLATSTAEGANLFEWNLWNWSLVPVCFPSPESVPSLTQVHQQVPSSGDLPCLFCFCGHPSPSQSVWLGHSSSSAGLEGLHLTFKQQWGLFWLQSSGFPYYT